MPPQFGHKSGTAAQGRRGHKSKSGGKFKTKRSGTKSKSGSKSKGAKRNANAVTNRERIKSRSPGSRDRDSRSPGSRGRGSRGGSSRGGSRGRGGSQFGRDIAEECGNDIVAECRKLIRPLINRYADNGQEIEISVHLVDRSQRKETLSDFDHDPPDQDISVVADLNEDGVSSSDEMKEQGTGTAKLADSEEPPGGGGAPSARQNSVGTPGKEVTPFDSVTPFVSDEMITAGDQLEETRKVMSTGNGGRTMSMGDNGSGAESDFDGELDGAESSHSELL